MLRFVTLFCKKAEVIPLNNIPIKEFAGMNLKLSNINPWGNFESDQDNWIQNETGYNYLWVYNTTTKEILMWKWKDGELSVLAPVDNYLFIIKQLDNYRMLNRLNNEQTKKLSNEFLKQENSKYENSKDDLFNDLDPEEQGYYKELMDLAFKFLAPLYQQAQKIIQDEKNGIRNINIKPGTSLLNTIYNLPFKSREKEFYQYIIDSGKNPEEDFGWTQFNWPYYDAVEILLKKLSEQIKS